MRVDEARLQQGEAQYRRGAIMGLTVAESFMLIAFALLMLLALWRLQKEEESATFAELAPEQVSAVAAAARDGDLDTLLALRAAGADLAAALADALGPPKPDVIEVPAAQLAEMKDRARLVSEEEIRWIAEAAVALDPETRRQLTNLVRLDDFRDVLQRLNAMKDILAERSPSEIADALRLADAAEEEGLNDADALRERIRNRLDAVEAAQGALVESLREKLGGAVAEMGGRIEQDGAVVLPDELLFRAGSAELLPPLSRFLEAFCAPWLLNLQEAGLEIDEIRIEGHASSEWQGATSQQAFVRNLDLSQRRAQAVLERCLRNAANSPVADWARQHLTAIGYSSSRPVLVDGREDARRSRRVVFNTSLDRGKLLDEIGGEISEDGNGSFVGRATVIDADTIEVNGNRLRLRGIDAPESAQTCTRHDGTVWRCGEEATAALSRFIGDRTVSCTGRGNDRYGRALVLCDVGGEDLGDWLVRQGWSFAYIRYSEIYADAEAEARAVGQNIWSGEAEAPWDWRRAH